MNFFSRANFLSAGCLGSLLLSQLPYANKLLWGQLGPSILSLPYLWLSLHPIGRYWVKEGSLQPFGHTHQEFNFFHLDWREWEILAACPSWWNTVNTDWELRGERIVFLATLTQRRLHKHELLRRGSG